MKILVCTDGMKHADKAVEVAAQYAQISGSELTIMNVIESDVSHEKPAFDEYGDKQTMAHSIIDKANEIASRFALEVKVSTKIAAGPVSAEIVRIAEDEGFMAVFVGATGSGRIKKMLLGSVSDDVIQYAHCPVTVVR